MKEWKEEAMRLWAETELSQRQIARKLGKPKSTVNDFFRSTTAKVKDKTPSLGVYSIRTRPLKIWTEI